MTNSQMEINLLSSERSPNEMFHDRVLDNRDRSESDDPYFLVEVIYELPLLIKKLLTINSAKQRWVSSMTRFVL